MSPSEMPNVELGRLVRSAREAKRRSLRSLAAETGIPYSYLAHLERGVFARPSRDRLERIARALGQNVEDYYDAMSWHHRTELPTFDTYMRVTEREWPEWAYKELNQRRKEIDQKVKDNNNGGAKDDHTSFDRKSRGS